MSAELVTPSSYLLAVLLVISTLDGAQFVFTCPPSPSNHNFKAAPSIYEILAQTAADSDSESDLSSEEEPENVFVSARSFSSLNIEDSRRYSDTSNGANISETPPQTGSFTSHDSRPKLESEDDNSRDLNNLETSFSDKSKFNSILGFDLQFLGDTLSPPPKLCNTRFELCIDDMVFLGLPVRPMADGSWSRYKSRQTHAKNPAREGDNEHDTISDDPDDSDKQHSRKRSLRSMNMFHVVFVLNPPDLEYQKRCNELYHFIIRHLASALRKEQARTNYVSEQVELILSTRDSSDAPNETNKDLLTCLEEYTTDTLWARTIQASQLAFSLSQLYTAITTNSIANIMINETMHAFQIPIQTQFSKLPPILNVIPSGIYISTVYPLDRSPNASSGISSDLYGQQSDSSITRTQCLLTCGHFALLLLDEPENIIRDINPEPDSPVVSLIQSVYPTESLIKIASAMDIILDDVVELAEHLIYWRRARWIMPLTPRGVYIVSPAAPMKDIYRHAPLFKDAFPTLPNLPTLLSLISQLGTATFHRVIPSRDHRDQYLQALAWLIRYGYVTRLFTFVWIRVPRDVKIEVARQVKTARRELEAKDDPKKQRQSLNVPSEKIEALSIDDTISEIASERSSTKHDASSTATGPAQNELKDLLGNLTFTQNQQLNEATATESLLLDPARPTVIEKRWLAKMLEDKPPDIVALFNKVSKHFNGRVPLECIPKAENISRQDLRRLVTEMDSVLILNRHW
ncbi:hypothetical protein CANCADRAFT_27840 [Tortispora caseinolytica NRRL Y-17796]|uniref:Nitrogen permease regulator 3 n=1 Tax=Tortispora caseinolytica NRRL Y-17796 TaxID=767744 RepID=A0A1E4TBQ9_9ASCO|nr:hypothetical protein CANCADRAFT_27840 [Tortispora caseinolytica NRRL Y-17796]